MGGNSTFSTSSYDLGPKELEANARACFYGIYLAVLAYGALLMLYIQLTGILIARQNRQRPIWAILAYSVVIFFLASVTIGPIFKFSEESYVEHRDLPPFTYYQERSSSYLDVLGEASAALLVWIADILMLGRLCVIWNSSRLIMIFPLMLYFARLAVSIPMLIAIARVIEPGWSFNFSTAYHSLTLAFNLYITCAICLRLQLLRPKLEAVCGEVHAAFYTSIMTTFVESGSFFTLWETVFFILRSRSLFQWVFFFAIPFISGVTRILIVLRLAQDRAWSREIVDAIHHGILDWQVSSTHSIPLHDVPSISDYTIPNRIDHKRPKDLTP